MRAQLPFCGSACAEPQSSRSGSGLRHLIGVIRCGVSGFHASVEFARRRMAVSIIEVIRNVAAKAHIWAVSSAAVAIPEKPIIAVARACIATEHAAVAHASRNLKRAAARLSGSAAALRSEAKRIG